MHPELNYSLQHYQREIVRGVEGLVSTGVKQLEVGEFGLIMHVFKNVIYCWVLDLDLFYNVYCLNPAT
jgi:hypothetical protein